MSVSQNQLGQLLHAAGWLPRDEQLGVSPGGDLLPSLQQAWECFDLGSLAANARRQAHRTYAWLEEQIQHGAQLTLLSGEGFGATHWLGERFLWWPRGRLTGARIGIASSRLGRRLDTQADWFTVFRAACAKINRDQDVLLTVAATTADRYVRRAAELFGARVVSMVSPRASEPLPAWFRRIRQLESPAGESVCPAYLSPMVFAAQAEAAAGAAVGGLPLRDQVVVSLAKRLLVFHVRHRGHLERLVRARLDDPVWPAASVFLALGEDLVDRELADEFLDRGAVGWVVLDTLRHEPSIREPNPAVRRAPIIELPTTENWRWLTHCTRAQADGWPDQRPVDYWDELLLNRDQSDRSALAAVQRIIATQRLVATSRMVRGETKVVCFTGVPLRELPQLRSFRSHLSRWDFEPYGICVRQDWLADRGCLPVRYGDASLWESLAEQELPFFQVRTSRSRRSGQAMDWSVEREWRHVGDVNLGELPSEAGLIFVSTRAEAEQLAMISRWPITVLG